MVQFIPGNPSFAEQLAASLGQGASSAISNFAEQMSEKKKQENLLDLIKNIENQNTSDNNADPFLKAKMYGVAKQPELAKIAAEEAKINKKQSFAREMAGEPKVQALQDDLLSHEATGLRFDRLNALTSPEFEDKFPPAIMTALFTKNGELRPTAQATLSPEAQEFTKLVIDEIQGAQKTYGGKVSNFEAAQYLKKLPSLMNTPEGRRRILRDLRIMNKITEMHDEGVLDIIDRYGGPGKISVSKANSIYKKEHAKDEINLKKAFINPNEFPFTKLDDFNASLYPGVTIQDPETKQIFTSNGKTWKEG